MFFDALAVLVITFFASLGMVEAAEWLLKNPLRKKIKHKVFVVAKISSTAEEEIEPALRSVLAETDGLHREVFLDCEGISEEALRICERLERRFDCSLFRGEEELITMNTSLTDELDIDSLDLVDLVMTVEDEFSIELPDEALEGMKTIGDLVKYIEEN